MKLIVVDDNSLEREGICKMIQSLELDIDIYAKFENGRDAFEYLRKEKIDVVISDIQMPFMSGIELLHKLNQEKIKSKVIFVSCYDDFTYAKSAIDLEVVGYILKPVIKADLKKAIEKAIEMIRKENLALMDREHLLQQIAESRPMKREQFLRNLLFNYISEEKSIAEDTNILGMGILDQYKTVAVLKLGKTLDVPAKENEMLIMSGIINFLNTMSNSRLIVYPVVISNDMIAIVIVFPDDANNIEDIIISIKNEIYDIYGLQVSLGVSNCDRDIRKLHILYSQALEALSYTTSSHTNRAVFYSDVEAVDTEEIDIRVIQAEVNGLILGGKEEECKAFVNKYLDKKQIYSNYYLNNFAHCVIYSVQLTLLEYNKSLETEVGTSLWTKLAEFRSIINFEQFEQWILNVLYSALKLVHSSKDDAKEKLVNDVKRIIAAKYNTHLTVTDIANELFFSSKYVNYIFKSVTGKSIFDYLTEYRMEKAKSLLKEKDAKIYVVSEQVGYKRKTHFNDLFKQYTGLSPSEYKAKMSLE